MSEVSAHMGAGSWASKGMSGRKNSGFYRLTLRLADDTNLTEGMTALIAQGSQQDKPGLNIVTVFHDCSICTSKFENIRQSVNLWCWNKPKACPSHDMYLCPCNQNLSPFCYY